MEKQKLRSEIDSKYKWDLTKIYKTDNDFYNDLDLLKEKIKEYSKYKNNLFENIDNFKNYLKLDCEVDKLFNKLYSYANKNYDSDTTCVDYQKMVGEVSDCYTKYSLATSFVNPLIYENTERLKEFLQDEELIKYKRFFDEILRYKSHTLDTEKEEIISNFNNVLNSSDNSYFTLTDTDLVFPTIKDEEGNDVELTESNFSKYIKSKDRNVRIDAFNKLLDTYSNFKNTITSLYVSHINSDIAINKVRGYSSSLEKYLYPDKIKVDVYNNLIDTVSKRTDVINNYFKTIKETLGLEQLHRYDTYTDLVDSSNKNYSYEEGKKIVLDALSILGDDYISHLQEAFNDGWIDVYNSKGKRSGAYSSGCYDTVAYILLNYEDKLNDVSTLAHELGHSMHTYYSCKNNDRIYADYKIFVAEVASTTNELLLNDYLLKNSKDNHEKLEILSNLMSLYYATIVRQTMFSEFERDVYKLREEEKQITHEVLEEKYLSLCKKYFGDNVVVDDKIKYEWMRIPHFYYGFYVYKYATSISAATYIKEKLVSDPDFVNKYIKFLSSGDSMDPLDELKLIDIDLTDSKVIDSAMDKFNYYIDEFKKVKELLGSE